MHDLTAALPQQTRQKLKTIAFAAAALGFMLTTPFSVFLGAKGLILFAVMVTAIGFALTVQPSFKVAAALYAEMKSGGIPAGSQAWVRGAQSGLKVYLLSSLYLMLCTVPLFITGVPLLILFSILLLSPLFATASVLCGYYAVFAVADIIRNEARENSNDIEHVGQG
ncbi:MAG: hypothetical protein ACAH80_05860 [Alphaproteobacteria bacterium]